MECKWDGWWGAVRRQKVVLCQCVGVRAGGWGRGGVTQLAYFRPVPASGESGDPTQTSQGNSRYSTHQLDYYMSKPVEGSTTVITWKRANTCAVCASTQAPQLLKYFTSTTTSQLSHKHHNFIIISQEPQLLKYLRRLEIVLACGNRLRSNV